MAGTCGGTGHVDGPAPATGAIDDARPPHTAAGGRREYTYDTRGRIVRIVERLGEPGTG